MIAVKALYRQGKIEFLDPPPEVEQSLVAIVFLEIETVEDALAPYLSLMGTIDWGESPDEEDARTLLAVHEELAPFRAEVNQSYPLEKE